MKQNEAPAASVYYRETYRSSPSRLPQTKRGNRVNRQTSDALQHAGACGWQAGPHSAPRRRCGPPTDRQFADARPSRRRHESAVTNAGSRVWLCFVLPVLLC